MRKSRYQLYVINVEKLRKDVEQYCERNRMYMKDFYAHIGMCSNILSNSVSNLVNNKQGFDLSQYEYFEKRGLIQKTYLSAICATAGLNQEDYICKKKSVDKINAISAKDLVEGNYPGAKIDEIISAIESLGRIQAQSMELLQAILNGIDKLNDKWK